MRTADDEARTLRARVESIENTLDRLSRDDAPTSAAVLAQTVTVSSYPTGSGPKVIGVKAVTLAVAETEGATPTISTVGSAFYAICLGTALPAVGTNVLLEQLSGRWVFRS
jgi:hypothetical protein